MTWLDRLKESEHTLSRAERQLVDFLNDHPDLAVRLTQRELAEKAGVSKPVLINAFRRLGFESFRDLQRSVADFFATQIDSMVASRHVQARVTNTDDLIREAAGVDMRSLDRLSETLDNDTLAAIARRIEASNRVLVMGPSTGFYPAHYLAQRLIRYGITTTLVGQDERHIPEVLHLATGEDTLVYFHYNDDDSMLRRILTVPLAQPPGKVLVSPVIHPDYVEASDLFLHVPRGEMSFKNSMAVPMHVANLILLAFELLFRSRTEAELTKLESTRHTWNRWVSP